MVHDGLGIICFRGKLDGEFPLETVCQVKHLFFRGGGGGGGLGGGVLKRQTQKSHYQDACRFADPRGLLALALALLGTLTPWQKLATSRP